MERQNLYRLPQAISELRRRKGVKQAALAQDLQVDPSRLSAIENGRSVGPARDLVDRLCSVLELDAHEANVIRTRAAQDRVMREVARNLPHNLHDLVAASLDAARTLGPEDRAALLQYTRKLVGPRGALPAQVGQKGGD